MNRYFTDKKAGKKIFFSLVIRQMPEQSFKNVS